MIRFKLITLNGTKFDDDVYEVILPTLDGIIAVLPGHMPLISAASHGVISVRRNAKDRDNALIHFATNGGIIEVDDDTLRVLVDEADHEDDINEKEVQAAIEAAMKLHSNAKDSISADQAKSLIGHHQAKLHVTELRRHKRRQK